MINNNSEKSIWVVRHGFRIDFTCPGWVENAENPYNPPLDPAGLIQAEETAERLKNEDIQYIFASPFYRTLQTANAFAEKAGIKFNVEKGFSEWLQGDEFKNTPVLSSAIEAAEEFSLINTDYKSLGSFEYPESRADLDFRVDETLKKIIDKYKSNILIISHGSPIKSIYKSLTGSVPEDYQPMCSVTKFGYSSNGWEIEIDAESSHLSTPDNTNRAFYRERGANYEEEHKSKV